MKPLLPFPPTIAHLCKLFPQPPPSTELPSPLCLLTCEPSSQPLPTFFLHDILFDPLAELLLCSLSDLWVLVLDVCLVLVVVLEEFVLCWVCVVRVGGRALVGRVLFVSVLAGLVVAVGGGEVVLVGGLGGSSVCCCGGVGRLL